jgi:membrane protease YdiL (CAAX protease family)
MDDATDTVTGTDSGGALTDGDVLRADRSSAGWVRVLLVVEFVVLFFGVPTVLAVLRMPEAERPFSIPAFDGGFRLRRAPVIPTLLGTTIPCVLYLVFSRSFPKRWLWNREDFLRRLGRVFAVFYVVALGMTVTILLWAFQTDRLEFFASFLKRRPDIWILVMVLYPLFSVYPQELIYRSFLFHRYRSVFRTAAARIVASALAFGYVHIVFGNWIAVLLTLFGGLLFAYTYHRTKSLLMASIEHVLYGQLIFTVGLGSYFYGGIDRFVTEGVAK